MKSSPFAIKIEIVGHPAVKPGLVVCGDFDPHPEHRTMDFEPVLIWQQLHDADPKLKGKASLERWEVLNDAREPQSGGPHEKGPTLAPGDLVRLILHPGKPS